MLNDDEDDKQTVFVSVLPLNIAWPKATNLSRSAAHLPPMNMATRPRTRISGDRLLTLKPWGAARQWHGPAVGQQRRTCVRHQTPQHV